ncbi:unnamed protein product [Schistocephalus solidus]|uniref:Centromere protein X n=1 Tax=Schistocephalus solidus TaxID=70667 RepID=A0A183TQS0_SCHSO|nr:unnamed protein product [Schistocephalus solidus]
MARFADPSSADSVPVSADLADIGDDLEKEKNESSTDLQPNKKSELGNADGSDGNRSPSKVPIYKPRQALLNALRDWLALMHQTTTLLSAILTSTSYSYAAEFVKKTVMRHAIENFVEVDLDCVLRISSMDCLSTTF